MKNRSPKLSQFQMSLDTARSARLATASVPEDTVPISRSRPDSLHRTPAGFTALALDGYGLCDIVPARSTSAASYLVSVRRVATLLHVSSRQSLTVLPPASAAQRCSSAFLYHGLGSLTLGRPGRHDAGLPGKSRVGESRTPGSVRVKAEWLSYSTTTQPLLPGTRPTKPTGPFEGPAAPGDRA